MKEQLKPWLLASVLVLVAPALVVGLYVLASHYDSKMVTEVSLPLLTISGIVVLLMCLVLVSAVFAIFGLCDKSQALALPEGSIRAVIALSLVVLFAILSVLLYTRMSAGQGRPLTNLTEEQKNALLKSSLAEQVELVVTNAGNGEPRYSILLPSRALGHPPEVLGDLTEMQKNAFVSCAYFNPPLLKEKQPGDRWSITLNGIQSGPSHVQPWQPLSNLTEQQTNALMSSHFWTTFQLLKDLRTNDTRIQLPGFDGDEGELDVTVQNNIQAIRDRSLAMARPQILRSSATGTEPRFLFRLPKAVSNGLSQTITNLTTQQVDQFERSIFALPPPVITNAGPPGEPHFTVYLRSNNQASNDFAKQLLVMIGTLVTSVASFYFGSKTSAGGTGSEAHKPGPPTARSLSPATTARGTSVLLEILGDNLDLIKEAKFLLGTSQIASKNLTTSPSLIKCELDIPPNAQIGKWDLILTDGLGRQAKLLAALEVTQ